MIDEKLKDLIFAMFFITWSIIFGLYGGLIYSITSIILLIMGGINFFWYLKND